RILFSKFDYFIFEGGVFHLPTWLFVILCRVSGKKALFWTHGFKGFDRGIKKIIRIFYFKLANALLLYGNYSKDLMVRNGFDEKKLFVVYNSLDSATQFNLLENSNPSLILKHKAEIFANPELQTIIFIGRLVPAKKIDFLLNAIKELRENSHPLNCIIIGDGPELPSINAFIEDNKLQNNIHITGALYAEDKICEYFQMSNLMISPGNVGLNCMHSLAYGVPVLTHDNLQFHGPEVEAIAPGKTGLLFKHNSYEDLLAKIKEWNALKLTKEEIKINCQKVISDKYNPAYQAEKIITAINSL
ncbi:MAG: glycosyltransferase, partial [Ferruginibacter sp.]